MGLCLCVSFTICIFSQFPLLTVSSFYLGLLCSLSRPSWLTLDKLTVISYYRTVGIFHTGSLFRFEVIYHHILKYAVKFSKQDLEDDEYKTHFSEFSHTNGTVAVGISKELFEYLVDHIRPRRVHVLYTSIKLIFVVFCFNYIYHPD